MKTLATVFMVSATVLAGAAHAELLEVYPPQINASSQDTRAAVVAELRAAQAAGTVNVQDDPSYPALNIAQGTADRAQVQAELNAAIEANQLPITDQQIQASTRAAYRS